MDREKQMDKMAKDLCHLQTCEAKKDGNNCYKYCKAYIYAFRACNAGYRKQSEVAMEIIGEILLNHTPDIDGFFTMHETELAELKKKYTEQK